LQLFLDQAKPSYK